MDPTKHMTPTIAMLTLHREARGIVSLDWLLITKPCCAMQLCMCVPSSSQPSAALHRIALSRRELVSFHIHNLESTAIAFADVARGRLLVRVVGLVGRRCADRTCRRIVSWRLDVVIGSILQNMKQHLNKMVNGIVPHIEPT